MGNSKLWITSLLLSVLSTGCLFGSKEEAAATAATATAEAGTYLYVASGTCFSPAAGFQNGNRIITRYDLSTGDGEVFYDFNSDGSYDQPSGMVDLGDSILVSVNPYDNSTGNTKQVIKINKTTKTKSTFYQDATYLPAGAANTVRALRRSTYDGHIYVSRSAGVEKVDFTSYFKLPNYSGTLSVPYLNGATTAMGSTSCLGVTAVANTLVYDMVETASGRWIVSHAVSTHNKIAVVKQPGGNLAVDCTDTQQGLPIVATNPPTVGAAATTNIPTALVLHSGGKLLAAMSGTAATSNSIISFDYNDTTGLISGQTVGYYGVGQLFQPTAMVEDPATGNVYVASYGQLASGALGFIRKFTVDSSTGAMTDAGGFANSPIATKCVSSMFIGQ